MNLLGSTKEELDMMQGLPPTVEQLLRIDFEDAMERQDKVNRRKSAPLRKHTQGATITGSDAPYAERCNNTISRTREMDL
jgi:hypothetical protein